MKINVAIDNIWGYSSDKQVLETFAEKVRAAGHEVRTFGVGHSEIQNPMKKSSNACDIMVQIAGGMCLGTLVDFYMGCSPGRYYHAKKASIPLYTKGWTKYDPETWKAHRAWDDHFSRESDLQPYKGKTLPEIYNWRKEILVGWSHANTAEELAKMFLSNINGGTDGSGNTSASTGTTQQAGTTALDKIKEVTNDWDKYGIQYGLDGDTFKVQMTDITDFAVLDETAIIHNSVTYTDYDSNVPNTLKRGNTTIVDNKLVQRFGTVEGKDIGEVTVQHAFQLNKRGYGHTIDLKCLISPYYQSGCWIRLNMPTLGIENEMYFITKATIDGNPYMSLTLAPMCVSRYLEQKTVSTASTASTGESGLKDGVYFSGPHKTTTGGNNLGQINGYNCGPHSLMQCLYKFGVDIHESTLAGWAGTTTSGTGPEGIRAAMNKAASQKGISLSWEQRSFSGMGSSDAERFKAMGEIISQQNKAIIIHQMYKNTWGHYEVPQKVNTNNSTVTCLNSLGSKCNSPAYCGSLEERSYSTLASWIRGISSAAIIIITKG